jgi:hypothetical protein
MDGSVATAECESGTAVKSRSAGCGRKSNKGRKNNRLQGKKVRKLFCRVQKESRKEPFCKHGRKIN